jgi:hypothetical protein
VKAFEEAHERTGGRGKEVVENGDRLVRWDEPVDLDQHGHLALPHYMGRDDDPADPEEALPKLHRSGKVRISQDVEPFLEASCRVTAKNRSRIRKRRKRHSPMPMPLKAISRYPPKPGDSTGFTTLQEQQVELGKAQETKTFTIYLS